MSNLTDNERAGLMWSGLNDCKNLNGNLTISTVTHWLEFHGAGYPDVPFMQERVRDDAKLWASCSHQFELEAYLAASLVELEKSGLTDRAAKRLAALAFKSMSPETKLKFKEWILANE